MKRRHFRTAAFENDERLLQRKTKKTAQNKKKTVVEGEAIKSAVSAAGGSPLVKAETRGTHVALALVFTFSLSLFLSRLKA